MINGLPVELFAAWAACAVLASLLAHAKGRAFLPWLLYGCAAAPLAVLHVLTITTRACPSCAETILVRARRCPRCQADLPAPAPDAAPEF